MINRLLRPLESFCKQVTVFWMKNEAVKKKKNEEVSNKKAQYHYSLTSFQPQLGRDPDVRYKHCASP